jgi:hypothetical protein
LTRSSVRALKNADVASAALIFAVSSFTDAKYA